MRRSVWLALLACITSGSVALAQQTTGSVSGAVFDQSGAVLQEAAVRITGENLPAGRTTTTSEAGLYSFPLLIPGKYTIEAEKTGLGKASRPVEVQLGKDTQADITIGVSGLQEQVTVTAATPLVDAKSTEVSFNYQREFLETIPLERTYRGLFQLIPGVAENRSTVGPAAGGSRQDNTYLIDGVNITNPGFGYLSTEVNELDIQEVSIKRAGVSAEFGRTAGAVTNAISKSGTNRLSGSARFDWQPAGVIGEFDEPAFRDPLLTTVLSPAVGVGGPLMRDKLFWYGSARYFEETKWDRVNKLGETLPDEERTGHELYGKITATPTTKHLINLSYRDRPNEIENAYLGSGTSAGVASTSDNSSRVATASWGFFPTGRSVLDVKYLFMKENNDDTPVNELGYLPSPFDPSNLAAMGQYDDQARQNLTVGGAQYFNRQNYRRHEIKATFSQFFDTGGLNHELKVGGGYEFGEENLLRLANGWGQLVNETLPTGQRVIRARYYTEQPPQLGQGKTWAMFVQDNITISSRATLNAGVLMNRDEFAQTVEASGGCPATVVLKGGAAVYESSGDTCTFLRFGFGDEIQPRIGLTYNVREGSGDKAYVNWGRYYNMDQKSSGRSLAPGRIFQTQTRFALGGAVVSSGPLASTTGKQIDPDIKPIYSDEVLLGYATPFRDNYSLDVFFMYRNVGRFIEDVPTRLPDSGPYAAANLPCERWESCLPADAERTYRAFTVEVSRRLADRWSGSLSYTWSRFEGNFDLDYSTGAVFNTSSFIQDGPGTNVEEPNRFGPLRQDRPHVFKVFTSWMPIDNVTLGGYFRIQSGAPWNARGRDWEGAVLNYLEPPGTHRNPTWTNLDLLGSYNLRLNDRATATLGVRLLNVFGNQTRLSTDGQQFLDLVRISSPPYFGTYLVPNEFFGTGNQFAPPRRVVLSASVQF